MSDLYICSKSGGDLKQLTETFEDENFPRYFPDGQKILFSREVERPGSARHFERDLWTLELDGLKQNRITTLYSDEIMPAVSPNGQDIVFVGSTDGINNLYRVPLQGGAPEQMTHVKGGNFNPVFMPFGNELLFVSFRAGEQHLYRMPFQTSAASPSVKSKHSADTKTAFVSPGPLAAAGLRGGRPYKFRASTGFFFPIMFYSSTDGLFLSAYWQASEMLGNHQIQSAVTYASALNFLNYQIYYSYLRYRPQWTFGFLVDTQENVLVTTREKRREDAQFVAMTYPFDRFDSVQFRFLTTERRIQLPTMLFQLCGLQDGKTWRPLR